jgi:hypothetical protein
MSDASKEDQSQLTISEKRADLVSSALWLSFGSFVIWQALKLDYRDEFGPSAGFFPFWLGVISVGLGTLLGGQAVFTRAKKRGIPIASKSAALRMFLVAACLFAFVALIDAAGFFLAAGLLFFALLYVVERESLAYSLAAAVLAFAGFWLVFELGLKLQLPVGFMKFLRVI